MDSTNTTDADRRDGSALERGVMQHSPGPWTAYCRDVGYTGGQWHEDHFLQWEVEGPNVPDGRGSFYQADAHLVAAAPDMLMALQLLLAEWEALPSTLCEHFSAIDLARSAVAKASGAA